MKVGILVREETMAKCTGRGCLNALQKKKDAFAGYQDEIELLTFTHAGGDIDLKIRKMITHGIESVHLSSCMRAKSPDYEALANRLSEHFQVIGYTHGAEVTKSGKVAIILNKKNKTK